MSSPLLLGLGVVALTQNPPPVAPAGYVAVPELSDEFDGDALDTNKWTDQPKVRMSEGRFERVSVPHTCARHTDTQWQIRLHWPQEAVVFCDNHKVQRLLSIDDDPSLMARCFLDSWFLVLFLVRATPSRFHGARSIFVRNSSDSNKIDVFYNNNFDLKFTVIILQYVFISLFDSRSCGSVSHSTMPAPPLATK